MISNQLIRSQKRAGRKCAFLECARKRKTNPYVANSRKLGVQQEGVVRKLASVTTGGLDYHTLTGYEFSFFFCLLDHTFGNAVLYGASSIEELHLPDCHA